MSTYYKIVNLTKREHWLEGRWAGDRIAWTSDGDHGGVAWPPDDRESLYDASEPPEFRDVSAAAVDLLHAHEWTDPDNGGRAFCLGCGSIPVRDLWGDVRAAPELGLWCGRPRYEIVKLASGIEVVRHKPDERVTE